MGRRILATVLACPLTGIPLPGQTAALGVVLQSLGGHIGTSIASAGATLYDGDRIQTEEKGGLSLRAGTVQLVLSENTIVVMHQDESGLTPILERGSVMFRVEGGGLRLSAEDVVVRAQSTEPTVGQMTLENCAVVVASRIQALEVIAGAETKIVEAGKSYRVLLEGPGPCSVKPKRPPVRSGRTSRFLPIAIITGAGAGALIPVIRAVQSPDSP